MSKTEWKKRIPAHYYDFLVQDSESGKQRQSFLPFGSGLRWVLCLTDKSGTKAIGHQLMTKNHRILWTSRQVVSRSRATMPEEVLPHLIEHDYWKTMETLSTPMKWPLNSDGAIYFEGYEGGVRGWVRNSCRGLLQSSWAQMNQLAATSILSSKVDKDSNLRMHTYNFKERGKMKQTCNTMSMVCLTWFTLDYLEGTSFLKQSDAAKLQQFRKVRYYITDKVRGTHAGNQTRYCLRKSSWRPLIPDWKWWSSSGEQESEKNMVEMAISVSASSHQFTQP